MAEWTPEQARNFKAFFKGSLGERLLGEIEAACRSTDSVVVLANQFRGKELHDAVHKAAGKIEAFTQVLAIIENLSGDL